MQIVSFDNELRFPSLPKLYNMHTTTSTCQSLFSEEKKKELIRKYRLMHAKRWSLPLRSLHPPSPVTVIGVGREGGGIYESGIYVAPMIRNRGKVNGP